jgi:hypothetical protein
MQPPGLRIETWATQFLCRSVAFGGRICEVAGTEAESEGSGRGTGDAHLHAVKGRSWGWPLG